MKNSKILFLVTLLGVAGYLRAETQEESKRDDIVQKEEISAIKDFFTVEKILTDNSMKEFYDLLSGSQKEEFQELVNDLNKQIQTVLHKITVLVSNHDELINKYKEWLQKDHLTFSISFSVKEKEGPCDDGSCQVKKCFENPSMKSFYESLSDDLQKEWNELLTEMMQTCVDTKDVITSAFSDHPDLMESFCKGDCPSCPNQPSNMIYMYAGFDQPLPHVSAYI